MATPPPPPTPHTPQLSAEGSTTERRKVKPKPLQFTFPKPFQAKVLPTHHRRPSVPQTEQAGILAGKGARGEQHTNVSFSEKTFTRALTMPRSRRDDYHLLSREQQFAVVRLRTGHTRLNSHSHCKLKLAYSPACLVKKIKPQSTFTKDASSAKL